MESNQLESEPARRETARNDSVPAGKRRLPVRAIAIPGSSQALTDPSSRFEPLA